MNPPTMFDFASFVRSKAVQKVLFPCGRKEPISSQFLGTRHPERLNKSQVDGKQHVIDVVIALFRKMPP